MQLTTIAISSILALSAGTAQAGARFVEVCSRIEPEWVSFYGYVQAVLDGIGKPWNEVCLPAALPTTEVVDIVIKDLREEPSLQDLNAASLVYDSLLKTYPCP